MIALIVYAHPYGTHNSHPNVTPHQSLSARAEEELILIENHSSGGDCNISKGT